MMSIDGNGTNRGSDVRKPKRGNRPVIVSRQADMVKEGHAPQTMAPQPNLPGGHAIVGSGRRDQVALVAPDALNPTERAFIAMCLDGELTRRLALLRRLRTPIRATKAVTGDLVGDDFMTKMYMSLVMSRAGRIAECDQG